MDADLSAAHAIIRAHIPEALADLYLFGSRARGDARRWSDIDVAVVPKRPLPTGLLAETREDLENSSILLNVDLVDMRAASAALREAIWREGVPWNA